ncbi:hypothetical protein TNCV_3772961 [Trichonephila clavipes]|nr:hypothetical protein TNCV_3772961 [Trichonephila clavipes]
MNRENGLQNRTTLCLLTKPASGCKITILSFQFGETNDERRLNCIVPPPGIMNELLPWPACFLLVACSLENRKRVVYACTTTTSGYTISRNTRSTFEIYGSHMDISGPSWCYILSGQQCTYI